VSSYPTDDDFRKHVAPLPNRELTPRMIFDQLEGLIRRLLDA